VDSFLKLDSVMKVSICFSTVSSVLLHQYIPKAGPGRAIMLAVRSFFRRGPEFASVRTGDKSALLSELKSLGRDKFIVCRGPRGIGKTHLISDALTRTPGVVHVEIRLATWVPDDHSIHRYT
jgi:hypothetical protein